MLLNMMLDKICDFWIGLFFLLVTWRCCAVVGQVLMTVKFFFFDLDFVTCCNCLSEGFCTADDVSTAILCLANNFREECIFVWRHNG